MADHVPPPPSHPPPAQPPSPQPSQPPPFGTAPSSRSPLLPMGLLALVIVLVVGAGLLVERLTDDDLALPDTLPGGWTATDVFADEEGPEGAGGAQRDQSESSSGLLTDALGDDAVVRGYIDDDGEIMRVVAVDAEAGPYVPQLPVAPEALGLERAPFELVTQGDAVCGITWGTTVSEGAPVPDEPPASTSCQLGDGGRTYLASAPGRTPAELVEVLDDLVD